jgi:23S rRNA (guanosine2251-2'-O)-methyltransferase
MKKLNYNEILIERKTLDNFDANTKHPIVVILHNIRSNYNVGSLFRTCDSAFVEELILTGYTPHPPKDEIHKTALGATETVKWRYFQNAIDVIKEFKAKGYKIAAVEITDTKKYYYNIENQDYPIVLIMGNEITGVDDEIIDLCDFSLEIPMYGVKHSLNVSIAAGIVIYESVRKFRELNNIID